MVSTCGWGLNPLLLCFEEMGRKKGGGGARSAQLSATAVCTGDSAGRGNMEELK